MDEIKPQERNVDYLRGYADGLQYAKELFGRLEERLNENT